MNSIVESNKNKYIRLSIYNNYGFIYILYEEKLHSIIDETTQKKIIDNFTYLNDLLFNKKEILDMFEYSSIYDINIDINLNDIENIEKIKSAKEIPSELLETNSKFL